MALTRLAWRTLAARRLRTLLTISGIALAVGVLLASVATSGAIDSSVERTVNDLVGRADLRVAAFQERGLTRGTLREIEATPGVALAVPIVEQRTYLEVPAGAPSLPPPVTVLGVDPELDPLLHDRVLVEGTLLQRRDEAAVVITETLARQDGYGLGGEVTIQVGDRRETFRVVGILAGSGPLTDPSGRTVLVPIDAALRVLGLRGVSAIHVAIADGATVSEVEGALVSTLRTDPYVLSTRVDLAATLRASTAEFQATTALIAAVALFVAALLIFNTVSMTLAERMRELGLLRAAGASRRQVITFVLVGAVTLGVLGSVAGLGVGIALAGLVANQMTAVARVAVDSFAAPPEAFAIALAVGLAVTVAAALEPAWRASRISPVESLRVLEASSASWSAQLRWLVVVFAAVALVGLVLWPGAAGIAGLNRAMSVYAVLLVATLVSPFLLRPLGRVAGLPFAVVLRLEERLARGSLLRDRGRATATIGALTIGLAMIVALGGMAQGVRAAAHAWVAAVFPGDELVSSIRPVAPDEGVADALGAVPGVELVSPIAAFDVAHQNQRLDAAAIVGADFHADGRLAFVGGERETSLLGLDRGGTAVLPATLARRLGVVVGDALELTVAGGATVRLAVTGIVERSIPGAAGEAILVGWIDALRSFGVAGADLFALRYEPGMEAVAADAVRASARLLALEASALDDVHGAVSSTLDRVFRLFDGLAVVAVIVAALGIVNTLTMNVVERVREIGVLRATGMTRRQVGRMVAVEAGILGILGASLGSVTGLVAGWLMLLLAGVGVSFLADLPRGAIAIAFGLGLGASILAAYYPARLAARLSIVRAVQFE